MKDIIIFLIRKPNKIVKIVLFIASLHEKNYKGASMRLSKKRQKR